jgi:hypothetical protein
LAGQPHDIALALLTDEGAPNGDNTITTVVAATVLDYYGNPVPDGTFVDFSVLPPTDGVVITDGTTNADPQCDISNFEAVTGVQVLNQPGVVHVCVIYPGGLVGTTRTFSASAGSPPAIITEEGEFVLPPPPNPCEFNDQPCNDHNPCTTGEVCGGGTNTRSCVGGNNAGAPCTTATQCPAGQCLLNNPPTCQAGTPVTCPDDLDPCTTDVCNFFNGSCHQPVLCDDDGNVCTDDICDTLTGLCGVPNSAPCDDGDLCSEGETCANGACQPGTPIVCPTDFNPCTNDVCDPGTGDCGVPIVPCLCPVPSPTP